MWSRALPNATLKRAESSDRSDGLDELMAMAAATKPPATKPAKPVARKPDAFSSNPTMSGKPTRAPTPAEEAAHEAIVALRLQLADATVTEAVNARLAAQDAAAFFAYYDENEHLFAYTCERELGRNAFCVVDGASTLEGDAAGEQLKCATGDVAYLVRVANQSVFGDCVAALAEAVGSSAAMASVSNGAAPRYAIDRGRGTLDATLAVDVVVPTSAGAAGKLALASVDCSVRVALAPRTVARRVGRATLVNVFEDATRAAAAEIAAGASSLGARARATSRLARRLQEDQPGFSALLRRGRGPRGRRAPPADFATLLREAADRDAAPEPPPPPPDGDVGAMLASRLAF
ncbi:hypothetical protein SO694_00018116 [Aureococcus anophagefferens]|uniref:Uncharacterized protein n=1 Tax=Aureococcus anophagefferens TaxID=44056 RepID=A0ABR1G0K8_AURAN